MTKGIFHTVPAFAHFKAIFMAKSLAHRFAAQTSAPDLVEILAEQLSAPELNTVLLEVFRRRAERLTPAEVLRQYRQNRFVQPAHLDALAFRKFETGLFQLARARGFEALELSPLSPFGACSAMAAVPQNNVVSALRGTELTADATNVLALESARRRAETGFSAAPLRLCAAHRHVRAQSLADPRHTAHFKVFCLTTAGRDTGSFQFEHAHLFEHWGFYHTFLQDQLGLPLQIRLRSLATDAPQHAFVDRVAAEAREKDWDIEIQHLTPGAQPYYRILQAKIAAWVGGQEVEIADSGFTDWTQRLNGNRKERFLISGLGSEMLFRMRVSDLSG